MNCDFHSICLTLTPSELSNAANTLYKINYFYNAPNTLYKINFTHDFYNAANALYIINFTHYIYNAEGML